jgi:hypothetical protein
VPTRVLGSIIILVLTGSVGAADLYVSNVTGSDALDGRSPEVKGGSGPFATIAKAVSQVEPGDTVHLAPTGRIYRECIVVNGVKGTSDHPITVDGHGAWLTGADHVRPEDWSDSPSGPEGTLMLAGLELSQPYWNTLCIDGKMLWGQANPNALRPGELYWQPPNTLYYTARLLVSKDRQLWPASRTGPKWNCPQAAGG